MTIKPEIMIYNLLKTKNIINNTLGEYYEVSVQSISFEKIKTREKGKAEKKE